MLYYDCLTTSIAMYCRTPLRCAINKIVVFFITLCLIAIICGYFIFLSKAD